MGPRLNFFSVQDPNLRPTMLQPVVLPLFPSKWAPPVTCWNTSRKRLGFWEGDSPSLPLSEARRTGRWWCRLVGARLWRPFPGLAGWVRDARRRSNPGQSRPINTGTGRSFITPTSTGQDPGAAAMVTRRAGTCRVSPWTQVIGRNDLYSVRGARTWDWTRLTVLPESRMARNGFPLTFTSASAAPAGRSWCTMQPASQVRVGGVGGSVGMGSSRGEGTAGLLWCRGMPSGARRSWPTLRGNSGALSPTSRCWAASASSMAPTSSSVVVEFLMPTACRWERGRARRRRSMTTRSATWAAEGDPSSNQWCASRVSSAAWARAGSRGLYSHSWNCWAVQIEDKPSRARISCFTSAYWAAVAAGRAKYACWASPVSRGASARAQSPGGHPSRVAVFSNTCRNASTSSWGVIFGSSLVACARASGCGTCGAAVAWRAASSCSVRPCRVARCSTICCWRMLTSVRCFQSSSISLKGRSTHLWQRRGKNKSRKRDENSQRMWCCLPVILHWHARILHHLSRGEESHDKDCSNKCPEGGFIVAQTGKKVTNRGGSALVQSVLSSLVLVQGARARARWRLSGHTLLSTGGGQEMREISCSLSGGPTQQWRDLLGL